MIVLLITLYLLGAVASAGFLIFGTDFGTQVAYRNVSPRLWLIVIAAVIAWPLSVVSCILLAALTWGIA